MVWFPNHGSLFFGTLPWNQAKSYQHKKFHTNNKGQREWLTAWSCWFLWKTLRFLALDIFGLWTHPRDTRLQHVDGAWWSREDPAMGGVRPAQRSAVHWEWHHHWPGQVRAHGWEMMMGYIYNDSQNGGRSAQTSSNMKVASPTDIRPLPRMPLLQGVGPWWLIRNGKPTSTSRTWERHSNSKFNCFAYEGEIS